MIKERKESELDISERLPKKSTGCAPVEILFDWIRSSIEKGLQKEGQALPIDSTLTLPNLFAIASGSSSMKHPFRNDDDMKRCLNSWMHQGRQKISAKLVLTEKEREVDRHSWRRGREGERGGPMTEWECTTCAQAVFTSFVNDPSPFLNTSSTLSLTKISFSIPNSSDSRSLPFRFLVRRDTYTICAANILSPFAAAGILCPFP